MEEKEIKNDDVYGKLDFDSDEKVVFPTEVTRVKIDNRDVELPVEALNAAGWRKVNDDETVVKKAELSEEEARLVENNNALEFLTSDLKRSFLATAMTYAFKQRNKNDVYTRLIQAYYNGYTVKKEPRYYLKFPLISNNSYLNVYKDDDEWDFGTKTQVYGIQTQFTQTEIEGLQKDEQARGLDLNALKVRVPDNELED
ncbi:DUF1642 domain-containing protein [Ligilactobacillus murinus]|uniref:DUF1642 domain-containing protein n=1 Tax=Ligilactobacillus murinus TaxID=1622 RepID=UPI00296A96E9|nr:DUF1642 domain-containing protein [Ligilactobacillus murinus]WOY88167.1 DUF1642 domain-containing protein [Ligilactobacillus murinus]